VLCVVRLALIVGFVFFLFDNRWPIFFSLILFKKVKKGKTPFYLKASAKKELALEARYVPTNTFIMTTFTSMPRMCLLMI
jgi:hypothetical protein